MKPDLEVYAMAATAIQECTKQINEILHNGPLFSLHELAKIKQQLMKIELWCDQLKEI